MAATTLIQEIEVPNRHHVQPASDTYTGACSIYGSGLTIVTSHDILILISLLSWELCCYVGQEYVSTHERGPRGANASI